MWPFFVFSSIFLCFTFCLHCIALLPRQFLSTNWDYSHWDELFQLSLNNGSEIEQARPRSSSLR